MPKKYSIKSSFLIIVTLIIVIMAVFAVFFGKLTNYKKDKITVKDNTQFCGTIDGIECTEGYQCILDEEDIEDGGGHCEEILPTGPVTMGDAETKEECDKKGGIWGKWGLLAEVYCQISSKDFDNDCVDGISCQYGKCISYDNKIPGKCQKFRRVFGCISYIEDGKIGSALCID